MTELDPSAKRGAVALEEPDPSEYLVIGDFGGRVTEPTLIDRDNFDRVMASLLVNLAGTQMRELEDFHPDRLLARFRMFEPDQPAVETRAAALKAKRETPTPNLGEILQPGSLLEQIAGGGDPFDRYVRELAAAHASAPEAKDDPSDAARCGLLRALLHHPRFQAIEAAWRGLDFVIRRCDSELDAQERVYIAQFPWIHARTDLNDARDLRQVRMLRLLAKRRWRAVIALFSFSGEAASIEFLGRMALLASHAGIPFIAEGSADMGEHWEELRRIPEAGYVGLALPRFLTRLPYGAKTSAVDTLAFEEMPEAPAHQHYLWGNPALACLALLMAGQNALTLENLPLHTYRANGEWQATPPSEVWMTESEAQTLIDMGLMPLVSFKDTGRVRLAGWRAMNGKALRFPS